MPGLHGSPPDNRLHLPKALLRDVAAVHEQRVAGDE